MATTQQLTVTLTMSDDTTQNVTSTATYTSSDTAVCTVSAAGLVTAVAVGEATVTVAHSGLEAACAVTVEATPEGLSVSPDNATLDV